MLTVLATISKQHSNRKLQRVGFNNATVVLTAETHISFNATRHAMLLDKQSTVYSHGSSLHRGRVDVCKQKTVLL